jgi:hypothetical protein
MTMPKDQLRKHAVVFDDVGHFEAIVVAEYLIEAGLAVTFVTSHSQFGGGYVATTTRDLAILTRLYAAGDFRVMERSTIREILPGECRIGPLQSTKSESVPADHVVLVTHNEPTRSLYDELHREMPTFIIGDANSPRDVQLAIQEGHLTARAIGQPVQ